jgi:hypothetical protein
MEMDDLKFHPLGGCAHLDDRQFASPSFVDQRQPFFRTILDASRCGVLVKCCARDTPLLSSCRRAGGCAPTPTDYRQALRDVVSHCVYGVDKNPMAIQLAKTALWLEAYSPDRPLSFIDHHLRIGDALRGVVDPKVLEDGIPDEAYTALSGDDKVAASALKKQNKADLKSWRQIAGGDLLTQAGLASQAATVEVLDDDTPEQVAAKRRAWAAAEAQARRSSFARLADTFVAAFLAPKLTEQQIASMLELDLLTVRKVLDDDRPDGHLRQHVRAGDAFLDCDVLLADLT